MLQRHGTSPDGTGDCLKSILRFFRKIIKMVALRNASDTVVVELGSFESIQYNTTLARSKHIHGPVCLLCTVMYLLRAI
jgi:hypothetical protein